MKMAGTMGYVLDKEFFCRVEFVYIYDTSGDIKTIRTPILSTEHSLVL